MAKTKAKKYLSDERFARLEESLQQAMEHVSGKRNDFRTTTWLRPTIDKQGNRQPPRAVMLNSQTSKRSEENTNE